MSTLEYTQHTVAFPGLALHQPERDSVGVSLAHAEGGTLGEMRWDFLDLGDIYRRSPAVQMCVFGDGLPCLRDPRIQRVVDAWANRPDPDSMTPEDLIEYLTANGAVPSRYHAEQAKA